MKYNVSEAQHRRQLFVALNIINLVTFSLISEIEVEVEDLSILSILDLRNQISHEI